MTRPAVKEAIRTAPSEKPLTLCNLRAPKAVVTEALRNAVADGLCAVDISIAKGAIARNAPAGQGEKDGIDMGQRIVWPATFDCHPHVDKGQIWPCSPNSDGTFIGAINASGADFETHQTPQDVTARANFALRSAYAHGTALLRTHVDADPATFDARFGVLNELAQDWAGRIDVQLCPFTGVLEDPDWLNHPARATKTHATPVLSCFLQAGPGLDAGLDRVFRTALKHDIRLDFHADETLDPASDCLEAIARAALRHGCDQPILVGHSCSLSVQSEAQVARTLDLVAKTQIGIFALPPCSLYLQDRQAGMSPRQRGVAPLKGIRARGIPVAIGSDNTRDAFYAYRDLDVPDLFRDAMPMMQLDHPVGDWPATVTTTAADMMGRNDSGRLRIGGPADLILFSARPLHDRVVIRDDRSIDTTPPDFSDLDSLQGMAP